MYVCELIHLITLTEDLYIFSDRGSKDCSKATSLNRIAPINLSQIYGFYDLHDVDEGI